MSGRNAFTLVELMVVIAIIAVLAGLLLSAIVAVRDSARQVTCASNQRQVIMALIAYAGDNENCTPYADMVSAPSGNEGHRHYYGTLLYQGYLSPDQVVTFAGGVIRGAPSLRWPNAVSCPSFKPLQNPTPVGGNNTVYGVRWSWLLVPGETFMPGGSAKLSSISPDVPFIADTVVNAPGGPSSPSLGYSAAYWSVSTINDIRLHLVHGKRRAVCAYADGHAGARGREQLIEERILPSSIWTPP